jgi:hypothetical protein
MRNRPFGQSALADQSPMQRLIQRDDCLDYVKATTDVCNSAQRGCRTQATANYDLG